MLDVDCCCSWGAGREALFPSSSESLELSLLEDELLDSDELSELLIWSITLASAISSAEKNTRNGIKPGTTWQEGAALLPGLRARIESTKYYF